MKKQLKSFAGLFLLLMLASCATDQLEINETSTENSETVWAYDGDNTTLQKVIAELKNSEIRKPLERRLSKNEVLWKEAKFLLIDDKKRILVPFLSTDKENVIGVLALVKDAKGKTTFDMAVRSRLSTKENKLPFWNPDIWMGYFMASDKDILGIKNGNPGFRQTIANNKNLKANARIQCDLYETITSHCSYAYIISATGEAYGFIDRGCTDTYSYSQQCYWVPDPIIPLIEPTIDVSDNSGGGGNPLQIFNYLNGKADCIYQKLNINSPNFIDAIKKFDGEFPVSHLTFSINNNLPNDVYGETSPPSNFNINIEMSNTQLAKISDIGAAISIAHEIIHAEIFRKLLSAANNGDLNVNQYTTQERINFVNSLRNNFPGLYDYYYERYQPTWNHDMMAQHYRSSIADIIQQFDNSNNSRQLYEDLAWAGLTKLDVNVNSIAWNNLTEPERQRILQNLTNNFYNGPSNCN